MVPARKTSTSRKAVSAISKKSSTQKQQPTHGSHSKGRNRNLKPAKTDSVEDSASSVTDVEEASNNESDESIEPELDSDALDEEDADYTSPSRKNGKASKPKRKRASDTPVKKIHSRKRAKADSTKNTKRSQNLASGNGPEETDDEFTGEYVEELNAIEPPKTGWVPQGQISRNTLDFLAKLKDSKYNNREWFKENEKYYRLTEKEFKDFIESFTDILTEIDPHIPPLPPKDVVHRIYRDVRFSNDKTPYKKGFSATFSRSGRKGIFAAYHIAIKSGGESLLAAGSWCPAKNELSTIRSNILRSPTRLRDIITAPEFVNNFGPAEPHPQAKRQNIFGGEDELKVAPKGIDKGHEDIDLLKCRSFAVVKYFTDDEVLSDDFRHLLGEAARTVKDFVHCLNDMMTIAPEESDEGSE